MLSNVRVLAIGQNVQEENGKKVVVGGNATLELDPKQAEIVLYAQNTPGSHSQPRAAQPRRQFRRRDRTVNDPSDSQSNGLTIVRYGAAQQAAR